MVRLLFKGGYYLRAATNNDFTVVTFACNFVGFGEKIICLDENLGIKKIQVFLPENFPYLIICQKIIF